MLNFKAIALFFLIVASFFGIYYQIFYPLNSFCEEKILFSISRGENFKDISRGLKEKGIIKNDFLFQSYALLTGKFRNFKAGSYFFCLNENIKNVVSKIYRGETAQRKVTIIEGWNIKDITDYLKETGIVDGDGFLKKINSFEYKDSFSFLEDKPENSSLEGYLFPDTYFLPYGADEDLIIETMLLNFNDKLNEDLRKEIKKQGKSIFETITIASLIEKEVRTLEDKKIVSGIIKKRLDIGMLLQIDATIAYITGKKTTRISITETQIDSPYNTYRHKGLPIGPICSPGIESIEAAIFPQETDYLFYLSKPDGETVFSRNLMEHNVAKNKYLR